MKRAPLALAGIVAGITLTTAGHASALPNCGGQNAPPQPVPYTCFLPGIDITFQGVTRHFSAVVNANGTIVTATFTMSAPLPVAVPIRIVHHEGISGAGGLSDQSTGVIPAGQVTGTVIDSMPCRAGQLDVKAVFIANGQSQGRVGGPWIENGTGCLDTTSVVPPPTSTPPPSSAPPASPPVTVPGGPSTPVTPPVSGPPTNIAELPATGGSPAPLIGLGVLLILLGFAVMVVRRREPKVGS